MLREAKQCLSPLHNEVLMVRLGTPEHPITEKHVTFSSPDGLSIRAAFFHAGTDKLVRGVELNFREDVTLHFIASQWPGLYFILQFSSFYQRYGCSCMDGKRFNQSRKPCEHMREVEVSYV